mgnify:CR=1 FL=1
MSLDLHVVLFEPEIPQNTGQYSTNLCMYGGNPSSR